jgi:hypothetical protein
VREAQHKAQTFFRLCRSETLFNGAFAPLVKMLRECRYPLPPSIALSQQARQNRSFDCAEKAADEPQLMLKPIQSLIVLKDLLFLNLASLETTLKLC